MKRMLLCLLLCGCDEKPPVVNPGQPEQVGKDLVKQVLPKAEPDHEEREKVRTWLKENTPTGEWEEVRWWRANDVIYPGGRNPDRGIRLKYRTANELGGMSLEDEIFLMFDRDAAPSGPTGRGTRGFFIKFFEGEGID